MANSNQALSYSLGSYSYKTLAYHLAHYPSLRERSSFWLEWMLGMPCKQNQDASAVQLFPWLVLDAAILCLVRPLWMIVTLIKVVYVGLPASVLVRILPSVTWSAWLLVSTVFAMLSLSMSRSLTAVDRICKLMPTFRFDRLYPMDIESEFVWFNALCTWRSVESKRMHVFACCLSILALWLSMSIEMHPELLLKPITQHCSQWIARIPNEQALIVDVVAADMAVSHTIDRKTLNLHKFDRRMRASMGPYSTLYCYPYQMYFSDETVALWHDCIHRGRVDVSVWLSMLNIDWSIVFSLACGVLVSCLYLIMSKMFICLV